MSTTITLTGPQALSELKQYYPETWPVEILRGKSIINGAMKTFGMPMFESVSKWLKKTGATKDNHAIIAALHIMLSEQNLSKKLKEVDYEIEQFVNQAFALEKSENFSTKESGELRIFYTTKQTELQQRRIELINSFEVIGAEPVKKSMFAS